MTPAFERFPYDIFREIMLHTYVYTLRKYRGAEFDIEVLSPPMPASHVCRSWRRALLSDPTMWTCLLFPEMHPEWIMELLRRSDSSLLDVSLLICKDVAPEMSHDEISNLLSALFQQIHRFRVLRVKINVWYPDSPPDPTEVLVQQTVSYLQRPASKLQTLSFWYNYLDADPDFSPDCTFFKKLFSGDAPRLKRLYHRLSHDLEESGCPVFHNLVELRLTLAFDLNFDRFLDLLASSPRLKLLLLEVDSHNLLAYFEHPSGRKVGLPFLKKLVLKVDSMIRLIDFVLKHVTLPSSVQWDITSLHYPGLEQSPSISQLLSRAHFTSLHIRAFPSFARLAFQEKLNNNHINSFITYIREKEEIQDLVDFWDSVMRAIKSCSRIPHMELDIGDFSGHLDIFSTFFTPMSSLKSLVIRPDIACLHASGGDELRFLCLPALLPNFQDLIAKISDNSNTPSAADPIQNPEHNNNPPIPTTPVFPCPLLREVTVELCGSLETPQVNLLRAVSGLRREMGHPFQIHVCCSQIEPGVEKMLELLEENSIKISVSPLHAV